MKDLILAIETSCDETAAAVLKGREVLSNIISSQKFHNTYGGIVPELASRAHIKTIDIIVNRAIREAATSPEQIGLVAATAGPGLIGSLLVGFNFAKAFAISEGINFIAIDHIESHIFSPFIGSENIDFPFISLVVSGGHTILFLVMHYDNYKILGNTLDDAAGEAFDKVAKMLGLGYPGGPEIDRLSEKGNENFHEFPQADIKNNPYGFSFSGIKTSVLYYLRKNYPDGKNLPLNDICASFRKSVIMSLVNKTLNAADNLGIKTIAVSGGVSANSLLRKELYRLESRGYKVFLPETRYSTDNAAMIGYNAYLKSKFCDVDYNYQISSYPYANFSYAT